MCVKMGPTLCCLTLLLFLIGSNQSDGAKILLLPIPAGSHMLTFQQVAEALAERGHELHTVVNSDCKNVKKLSNLGVINHGYKIQSGCAEDNPTMKKAQMDMIINGLSLMKMRSQMKMMAGILEEECTGFLGDGPYSELKNIYFDVAIVDAIIYSRHLYALPYVLDIPVISIAAVTNLLMETGVPALPSFTPNIMQGQFTNQMTYTERVHNTFLTLFLDQLTAYLVGHDRMVAKFMRGKPSKSLAAIQSESMLWLIMNDNTIDYPQVGLPHVINIGGINTGPAKPLKPDFQKIADEATEGLIVVSFGSTISDFPAAITDKLYEEFRRVKQTLVWRYTGRDLPNVPPNVHLSKWLPQNDLLAHPNTKVFVTHCGCNGQFESVYHGIPMVGLPIFGDQKYNARRMAAKGMGVTRDLLNFKPGEVLDAINEVYINKSYAQAARKYSAIFRSQPLKPIERTVFWIEHVLEYGHEHLRSAAVDMPWYQYWCLDSLLTIFVIFLVIVCMFLATVFYIVRKCCSWLRKPKAAKGKKTQ